MPEYLAVLVEDDREQVTRAVTMLESVGFTVINFYDSTSALDSLASLETRLDLIVLDRRLPSILGDAPTNDVGDALLNVVNARYPGVPVIVFSGYSNYEHQQLATQNRGSIELRGGEESVDRVAVFRKRQASQAAKCAGRLASLLGEIDNVELVVKDNDGALPSVASIRLLKRVAYEYGAASIESTRLSGGATDADVWKCRILGRTGERARVIVKRTKRPPSDYGFHALLPASLTAATVKVVAGLTRGGHAAVIQAAADDAHALDSLVYSSPSVANASVSSLIDALDDMPGGIVTHLSLAEIVNPFAVWQQVEALAAEFGVDIPSPGVQITTRVAAQHGDLHPGNVLILGSGLTLIDFDSEAEGSRLIDPMCVALGGLFHKNSPMRDSDWPDAASFRSMDTRQWFVDGPNDEYFAKVEEWLTRRIEGPRELAAVLLGFAIRQLQFDDVRTTPRLKDLALAMVRTACTFLRDS